MKMRTMLLAVSALFLFTVGLSAAEKTAVEKTAAELLPASTAGYLEISDPKHLLGVVLDHPLRGRVEELDVYKTFLDSKEGQQLRAGIVFAEFQLGMELRPAVEKLTGGGIYLAGDPKTNGVALLIKAADQALLEKVRDTALKFARDNSPGGDPIKSAEYRGIKAYQAGDAKFALLGPWLVATNQDELGKFMIDSYLDGGESLATSKQFLAAREGRKGNPAAWGYVSVAPLREAGVANELYKDKSDNPVLEILFGGLLGNLKQTPYATLALYAETEQIRLVASSPHDPAWITKPREFYFGPGHKGSAPVALAPRQTAFSLGAYRDLSAMWLARSDLFDENVNAGFAQADSTLTTLFSGRDFGREILGAFRPEMQIVVARQDYKGLPTPEPDIKLPAGAIVFRLKDAEKMQPQFKLLFQSLVGFINVASAQQGQPPLDQNIEKRGEGTIISTTYLPDKSQDGKINYNFSPSLGFVGDRLILSSTSRLAAELVDLAGAQGGAAESPPGENLRGQLQVSVVQQMLQDNRKHLVAQNQLEKGHSQEAAEKEIEMLLSLLNAARDVTLRLTSENSSLNLELGLRLETAK